MRRDGINREQKRVRGDDSARDARSGVDRPADARRRRRRRRRERDRGPGPVSGGRGVRRFRRGVRRARTGSSVEGTARRKRIARARGGARGGVLLARRGSLGSIRKFRERRIRRSARKRASRVGNENYAEKSRRESLRFTGFSPRGDTPRSRVGGGGALRQVADAVDAVSESPRGDSRRFVSRRTEDESSRVGRRGAPGVFRVSRRRRRRAVRREPRRARLGARRHRDPAALRGARRRRGGRRREESRRDP